MLKLCLVLSLSALQTTLAADNDTIEARFGSSPRQKLPFAELVEYDGYEVETHLVTTSDGYILGVYRIPRNSSCPADENKLPLVFMHGLFVSSSDCIIPGPGKAHCYIYADDCHDVWVPNIRGNRYSRKHVSLDPDQDEEFWDFSLDDLALKDLPAIIDYILEQTGKKQVNYVAHSQGVGIAILLCAKKPEYNNKINAGFGLSVTAHLEHARFIVIGIQDLIASLLAGKNTKNFEILAHGDLIQRTGVNLCGKSKLQYPFCSALLFVALGYNEFQIESDTFRTLVGHVPAGTSFQNFERWGQMAKNGFSEPDLGLLNNLITYRQAKPPLFDLSAVTMPWYFIGSVNDNVGDLRDIATLVSQLTNVKLCVLEDKTFAHLDFIYGKDIPNYITPKILTRINGGAFECDSK